MTNETSTRAQHVFVVRLWSEATGPAPAQWRGSVEHIPSGQHLYFAALDDLIDFIVFQTEWYGTLSSRYYREEKTK
ncbi:MAG: hypothetical protein JW850_17780 [Thermoflexales bacterium]|nr:hypothetical protein [Thermoflexales bacterium]